MSSMYNNVLQSVDLLGSKCMSVLVAVEAILGESSSLLLISRSSFRNDFQSVSPFNAEVVVSKLCLDCSIALLEVDGLLLGITFLVIISFH